MMAELGKEDMVFFARLGGEGDAGKGWYERRILFGGGRERTVLMADIKFQTTGHLPFAGVAVEGTFGRRAGA